MWVGRRVEQVQKLFELESSPDASPTLKVGENEGVHVTCRCIARKKGRFSTRSMSGLFFPVVKVKEPRKARS